MAEQDIFSLLGRLNLVSLSLRSRGHISQKKLRFTNLTLVFKKIEDLKMGSQMGAHGPTLHVWPSVSFKMHPWKYIGKWCLFSP